MNKHTSTAIAFLVIVSVIVLLYPRREDAQLVIAVVSIERYKNSIYTLQLTLASDHDPKTLRYYNVISNVYLSCMGDNWSVSGSADIMDRIEFDGYFRDGKYYYSAYVQFSGPIEIGYSGKLLPLESVPILIGEEECIQCEYVFAFFPRRLKRNISSKPFCLPVRGIIDAINATGPRVS